MKWFYALNDSQQGPVDDDVLLSMLQNGTINAETLIWREGMAEWLPYEQVADAPKPGAPAASAADEGAGAGAGGSAAARSNKCVECGKTFPDSELISVGREAVCGGCKSLAVQRLQEGTRRDGVFEPFSIGSVVNRSFELAKVHWGFLCAVWISAAVIYYMIQIPAMLAVEVAGDAAMVLLAVTTIVGWCLSTWLTLGVVKVTLDIIDNGEASYVDMFSQGRKIGTGIAAGILSFLLMIVGLLGFIVGAIYVSVRLSLTYCYIVDRDMGAIEALKASWAATQGTTIDLFIIMFILGMIWSVSMFTCCIALLFTTPLMILGFVYSYRVLAIRMDEAA
jgi:DNA-directed RNA polymerase subunit RPC12/RpoP